MEPLVIINDVHLGVSRSAGTTPASALELRQFVQESLQLFLLGHKDKDVLILGDMFDGFTVDAATIIEAYRSLAAYLLAGGKTLHLVPGNHDWSPKGDKVSSFHMLGEFLQHQFDDKVKLYQPEFSHVRDNVYAIPHCGNQDLFELELQKAYEHQLEFSDDRDMAHLLLHCNVMNPFADKSDHSLNLTDEWAEKLSSKYHIVVAHEHQTRSVASGNNPFDNPIYVLGNQWPTSIADCLNKGGQQGSKFAHLLDRDGVSRIETWDSHSAAGYRAVDWSDLQTLTDEDVKFIRVSGTASAAEAADVISMIARFRAKSKAWVVTNAVSVEGVGDMEQMSALSLEQIQSFDVMTALLELLDPDERKLIQEVMSK